MSKGNRSRRRKKGLLPPPEKCKAHTREGAPCKNSPVEGSVVCRMHGGAAPQVRRKAAERVAFASDPAAAKVIQIMQDPNIPPQVQLAAAKDLLDRAGIGTTKELEITLKPWQDDLEGLLFDDGQRASDDIVDAEVVEGEPHELAPEDRPFYRRPLEIDDVEGPGSSPSRYR